MPNRAFCHELRGWWHACSSWFFLPSCKGGLEISARFLGLPLSLVRLSAFCPLYFLILDSRAFSPCTCFCSDPGNNGGKKERAGGSSQVLQEASPMTKIHLCPGWARDSSEQCLHEAPVETTHSLCFGWPLVLWGVKRILHRCRTVSSFFAGKKIGWVSTKNEVPCDFSMGISCGWSRPDMLLQGVTLLWSEILCSPMQSHPGVSSFFSWLPQFCCKLQEDFYSFLSSWKSIGFILPLRNGSYCSRFLAFQWKEMFEQAEFSPKEKLEHLWN